MAPCTLFLLCACALVLSVVHGAGIGRGEEFTWKEELVLKQSLGRAPLRGSGREGAATVPVLARRELAARLGAARALKPSKALVYPKDAAALLTVAARWIKSSDTTDTRKLLATWDARRPCAQWYGVTCDRATGRVTAIRLPQLGGQNPFFQLAGALPAELGSLPELHSLILARHAFNIPTVIPKGWASLKKLAHLDLSGSPFSLRSPDYVQVPPVLYNLTGLTYLNLGSANLDGPISTLLKELSGLVTLRLPRNSFAGNIPTAVGSLRGLMTLDLSYNDLTGSIPQELGSLKSLAFIDLSNNKLSGSIPAQISSLKGLVTLSLGQNRLTGSIPPGLGTLSRLETMDLNLNQLTGSIPGGIASLEQLADLDLSGNQLTGSIPQGLGAAAGLTSLELGNNLLTGTVPGTLLSLFAANIKKDEKANASYVLMYLGGNYLTGPCYSSSSAPPKCTSEGCDENVLRDLEFNCLQGCKKLAFAFPPDERSKAECSTFCGSDNPKGPCGGHGVCIPKGPKKTPTCTCSKGFVAPKSNPGTCVPK